VSPLVDYAAVAKKRRRRGRRRSGAASSGRRHYIPRLPNYQLQLDKGPKHITDILLAPSAAALCC